MKIKIGESETIYDSEKEPILLMLDDKEKTQIKYMKGQKKYCSFPEGMSYEEVSKFMDDNRLKEQKIEYDKSLSNDMVKAIAREFLKTRNVVVGIREITNDFQVVISYYSNPTSIPTLDIQEYSYSIYFNWKPVGYTSKSLEDAVFIISLLNKYDALNNKELALLRYEESIDIILNMIAMVNEHIKE